MSPLHSAPENMSLSARQQISRIQPPAWKNNVAQLFEVHWNQDYFLPLQMLSEEKLLGIGELMILEKTAWLGNIVVDPNHQRQGIGRRITQALMDEATKRNVALQLLLATLEGEALYADLGFQLNSRYLFYQTNKVEKQVLAPQIIPFIPDHLPAILAMDARATGENRSVVLIRFLEGACVYWAENAVQGFYLPRMGDGLVIAKTETAGIALLQKRTNDDRSFVILPEINIFANAYLQQKGYTVFRKASLMHLGPMKTWEPTLIYSRIGGYLG